MPLVRLRASNTHLYPGARMTGPEAADRVRRGDPVVIEFADLGNARGFVVRVAGEQLEVAVGPHRTAHGTPIAAKRWVIVRVDAADEVVRYRVLRPPAERGAPARKRAL